MAEHHHGGGGHGGEAQRHSMHMMHMSFYWGKEVTVLFDSWSTASWAAYWAALAAIFAACLAHEWLTAVRSRAEAAHRLAAAPGKPGGLLDNEGGEPSSSA
eukprot:SM000068S20590  [mRNA]  locus=s68:449757:450163:+ [translate_table: standard]